MDKISISGIGKLLGEYFSASAYQFLKLPDDLGVEEDDGIDILADMEQ